MTATIIAHLYGEHIAIAHSLLVTYPGRKDETTPLLRKPVPNKQQRGIAVHSSTPIISLAQMLIEDHWNDGNMLQIYRTHPVKGKILCFEPCTLQHWASLTLRNGMLATEGAKEPSGAPREGQNDLPGTRQPD